MSEHENFAAKNKNKKPLITQKMLFFFCFLSEASSTKHWVGVSNHFSAHFAILFWNQNPETLSAFDLNPFYLFFYVVSHIAHKPTPPLSLPLPPPSSLTYAPTSRGVICDLNFSRFCCMLGIIIIALLFLFRFFFFHQRQAFRFIISVAARDNWNYTR